MFLHILFYFLCFLCLLCVLGTVCSIKQYLEETHLLMRLYYAQAARRQALVTIVFLIALTLLAHAIYT